jgi:hypothetical protein
MQYRYFLCDRLLSKPSSGRTKECVDCPQSQLLRQVVEETRSIRKKARLQARAETRKRRSDHLPK